MKTAPKVGESVKVHLPSESPWADCVAVYEDGTWDGKIANDLIESAPYSQRMEFLQSHGWTGRSLPTFGAHAYKYGDVVRFRLLEEHGYSIWVPAV